MIVAAVPLKDPRRAKTRLRHVLDEQERRRLVRGLLCGVLEALLHSNRLDRVALATPDQALAGALSVDWVPDAGDLNATLRSAAEWAQRAGARGLLIVPGDLPRIESADVVAVVDALRGADGVVISPTHDGGTGALLIAPPFALSPQFGPDSFRQHVAQAAGSGQHLQVVERPGLSLDVDTPEDLASLAAPARAALMGPAACG